MILVYSHKITPRLTYIFRQIFIRVLELPVDFTSAIEKFVSHSGPKLSYTHQPLGNEFFIASHDLLFQKGIQEVPIEVSNWSNIPAFFKLGKSSQLPYDIFAASFFLMTRYEEFLPQVKNDLGAFVAYQSLASKNNFLEMPVVDLWAVRLKEKLHEFFPELPHVSWKKPKFQPIISVVNPYKYEKKSLLLKLSDTLSALWQLDFFSIIEQSLVLLGLQKDPHNNFEELEALFKKTGNQPLYFFLFSKNTFYDRGVSIHNFSFRRLIKNTADLNQVSLLASHAAQQESKSLNYERQQLKKLIIKKIDSVRFNYGLLTTSLGYYNLLEEEIQKDYSMGYSDEVGYRASTAVPFYFYDLNNELQTSLKIHPVVADEAGLRKFSNQNAFKKLMELYENLPTSSAFHGVSFSNAILNAEEMKNSWRDQFINYIQYHAR
ncbi:hypothetical protein OAN35_01090 [Flavobacteriaceae bacterium]|nr:hypothetical protein [Flavobacteriaceae bacterium]